MRPGTHKSLDNIHGMARLCSAFFAISNWLDNAAVTPQAARVGNVNSDRHLCAVSRTAGRLTTDWKPPSDRPPGSCRELRRFTSFGRRLRLWKAECSYVKECKERSGWPGGHDEKRFGGFQEPASYVEDGDSRRNADLDSSREADAPGLSPSGEWIRRSRGALPKPAIDEPAGFVGRQPVPVARQCGENPARTEGNRSLDAVGVTGIRFHSSQPSLRIGEGVFVLLAGDNGDGWGTWLRGHE